jgi:hypothetical protein
MAYMKRERAHWKVTILGLSCVSSSSSLWIVTTYDVRKLFILALEEPFRRNIFLVWHFVQRHTPESAV